MDDLEIIGPGWLEQNDTVGTDPQLPVAEGLDLLSREAD
jgi:hypothetical protein